MKVNQLKAGAVISYVNLLVGNIIPFIYTPIMLRLLGQAEYGLYGIAQSIMGYIALLNFGIGGTVVRYLSKYRAEENKEQESRVIGLFIKIYVVICVLILMTGLYFATHLGFFDRSLSIQEIETLRILVILMTINVAFFIPFSVFNSIVIAYERYIFSKLVEIISTFIAPIMNIVMLCYGFGSVGLVIVSIILNVITYSLYTFYALSRIQIKISFKEVDSSLIKEIVRYSAFIFLATIVDTLYWTTDKIIIGWAIGTAATAIYNIGATFNTYITGLSTAFGNLLIPKLTEMVVKDASKDEFTNIFIKVGRLQFIIVSFIVSAFVAFGRQFIILWAGPEYNESYLIALLIMVPITIPLIQNTGMNILYALNKHQFRSIIYACIAVLNVLLTFWWVEKYGIIGAAMATCLAYVIGNILIINWYYYKRIGIDIPLFWKNILKMSPVMFVMGTVTFFILDAITINNWLTFFVTAVIYTAIYFVLSYHFMMNQYERDIIIVPIKRVLQKLRMIK